jgi:hypothetical protein
VLLQQKSETGIAVDDESALVIIAEEAREVLDVRGIPNVVRRRKRIALEVTIVSAENRNEIDMLPDHPLGIWLQAEILAAAERVVENETVSGREMGVGVMAMNEMLLVSLMKLDGMVSVAPSGVLSEDLSEDQKEEADAVERWEVICGVKNDEIVVAQERMEEEKGIVRKGWILGEERRDQDDRWGASRPGEWIHLADLYDGLEMAPGFRCMHALGGVLFCKQRNIFEAFNGEMGDCIFCGVGWETEFEIDLHYLLFFGWFVTSK